jgi:L-lactate dehydrogenase complex protein LldG
VNDRADDPVNDRVDDRELVLGRIRAALQPSPAPVQVPRSYRTSGDHPAGAAELLDLLTDRLVDYRAEVYRCRPDGVAEAVGRVLAGAVGLAGGPVLRPAGLDPAWLSGWTGTTVTDPDPASGPLPLTALDAATVVVTGCAVAIAETGTIVLDGSADQGRRAITLVPDRHLVVVRVEQVVHGVPAALARLQPDRPLTMISGPSATSDIELERVEGVHGPRILQVVLVG